MRKLSLIQKRLLILGFVLLGGVDRAAAVEPDKLLPAETDAVLTVNLKALLDSGAVKKYALAEIKKGIEKNELLAGVFRLLTFDPLKDLHTITAAISKPQEPAVLLIVRGNFNRDQAQVFLDLIATSDAKKFGVSEHRKVKIYQTKEGENPGYGALLDKETLVLSASKAIVEKAIDQNQANGKINLNKDLEAALKKVDGKQTIWLAVGATEPVKKAVRKNPDTKALAEKLRGAVVGLTVKDGLQLDMALHTTDPEAVKAFQGELENGKQALLAAIEGVPDYGPILVDILKGVTVRADGGALRLRSDVSGEIIERLLKKAQENR